MSVNSQLGPPPIQTRITAQGPDNFGVRFEDRDVASGNLNTGWAQWFFSVWENLVSALASIVSLQTAQTALTATVTALSATVTALSATVAALSTAFTAFQSTGTFTPTLAFGGASTGITYSIRLGDYCKVGNVVTIRLTIVLTSKGSSTGHAVISGLPFNVNVAGGNRFGGTIAFLNGMSGLVNPYPTADPTAPGTIDMFDENTGTHSYVNDTSFSNTTNLQITMTYFT